MWRGTRLGPERSQSYASTHGPTSSRWLVQSPNTQGTARPEIFVPCREVSKVSGQSLTTAALLVPCQMVCCSVEALVDSRLHQEQRGKRSLNAQSHTRPIRSTSILWLRPVHTWKPDCRWNMVTTQAQSGQNTVSFGCSILL